MQLLFCCEKHGCMLGVGAVSMLLFFIITKGGIWPCLGELVCSLVVY